MEMLLKQSRFREITTSVRPNLSRGFSNLLTWELALVVLFNLLPMACNWLHWADFPPVVWALAAWNMVGMVATLAFQRKLLDVVRGNFETDYQTLLRFAFHRFGAYFWAQIQIYSAGLGRVSAVDRAGRAGGFQLRRRLLRHH